MPKFRKKPVVIEAHQWNPLGEPAGVPDWLFDELSFHPQSFDASTGVVKIRTLEGVMTAQPGDWIIRGVKGEIYPCKPDVFEATYEAVE